LRRTYTSHRNLKNKPTIGLALGSGAARGWAHVGVIRELAEMGIRPDVIAGSSVGGVVGGAWASGHLDKFEEWVTGMGKIDIIRLLDAKMTGGGFLKGSSIMSAIEDSIGDPNIEDLEIPFACVATELGTGREVWLEDGPLLDACRASIALPGLFAPFRRKDDSLLVDGGLVNPVPVSLARALGADFVIAVNLNGDLVGHHFWHYASKADEHERMGEDEPDQAEDKDSAIAKWTGKMKAGLGVRLDAYISSLRKDETPDPGLFDVIVGSIDIMQDRLTRSRMAGEPPDIHIKPRLSHIGLMDFDRAGVCIEEGRKATRRQGEELDSLSRLLAARSPGEKENSGMLQQK
jgi:NTE family protein